MHKPQPNQTQAFFWVGDFDNYFFGHQFEEIFKARIYKEYLEEGKDTVIDLGANVGLFSLYASKYAKQVYSLEPSLETFGCLESMLVHNGIKNVTPINKALYIENGTFPFGGPTMNKTMRSLHAATWQDGKPSENVATITFEKLFDDYKIDHVDLLKTDVEGSEIEIFSSPSFKAVAHKIDTIVGESHNWSGRHPNQLKESLKNNGFTFEVIPGDAQLFVAKRK